MKTKITKIALYLTLAMVVASFLPWIYLTPIYYILRYGIMLCMGVIVILTFSLEKVFNERFMRLFALTILLVVVEFILFRLLHQHYQISDLSQLIIAFLCICVGMGIESDLKQWGNICYFFTLCLIAVGITNCLYYAGGLYIPEYYMFDEGKNQLGGLLSTAGVACYFFGIKDRSQRTHFFVLFFLSLLILLLIRARSDCFALIFCALFLSAKDLDWKITRNLKTVLSILGILLIGYILYNAFFANELHTFMVGGKSSDTLDEISSNRIERDQQAFEYLLHDPLMDNHNDPSDSLLIHNYILLRLVRYGIWSFPLVGFYLYFVIKTLYELLRTRKTDLRQVGYVVCSIPLIVSLVEPNFPYGPGSVQILAFLLLGVSFRQNRIREPITRKDLPEGQSPKVLHLCNDFTNSKVHTELYQHLEQLGVQQVVYSPIRKAELTGRNYFEGDHTEIIYSFILKPLHRIFFNRKIEVIGRDLRKKVDLCEVGYVHAINLFSDGATALYLKQHYGLPYVVAVRNSDLNDFLKLPHLWWVHRAVIREADKVIFISPAHAKRFQRHFTLIGMQSLLREKSIVRPNGINPYWLQHLSLHPAQHAHNHHICYVGNFDDNKNVMRLAQAVLNLQHEIPDIHLDLVGGTGNRERDLLQLVEKNQQILCYKGKIYDKEELRSVYLDNSIFAMPSIHETFGLVYLEALSQGLSVLYTHHEGIDGLFTLPIGEAVHPTSLSEIQAALRKLLLHPERYTTLPEEEFHHFDWNTIARFYQELYAKC